MTRVFNTRIVFRTLGALLLIESIFMGLTTLLGFYYDAPDKESFLVSTVITLLAGLLGLLFGRHASSHVTEREGYVIVAFVWIVFSIFGLLPYYMSGEIDNLTDAWFETMSGFTTTGATILPDVEAMTKTVLFWRAMTQWLGGLGIIVLCVALLPMFGLGGMQLYAAEVTGVSYEKLSPRIADTAKRMWLIYILLTVCESFLLNWFGMSSFDAVCHSMSTVATGGFSTRNLSVINDGPAIQYTIALFMLLSGINFTQIIYIFRGQPGKIVHDEETHWYLGAIAICTLLLSAGLFVHYGWLDSDGRLESITHILQHGEKAFRKGFFMITSAMTSSGFAASDYMSWPKLLWVAVFFVMFTGASSGSTSGGIKWVRIGIFAKSALAEIQHRIHPNAIVPVRFNGRAMSPQTTSNVMAFMFFYISIIAVTVLVFCACGITFDEAIGTAVSAIGNVGVSIGQFGPLGSYADFPTFAKWWMTLVMLIGRLEIFTIILLFTSALWKK